MFLSSKTIILIRQVVSSCVLLSNVLLHHVLMFKRKSFFDCFAALTFSRVSSVGSWNCHWVCQLRKSSRVQNWTDRQFTVGLIPFVLMHKHSHTIEKIVNEVNYVQRCNRSACRWFVMYTSIYGYFYYCIKFAIKS